MFYNIKELPVQDVITFDIRALSLNIPDKFQIESVYCQSHGATPISFE